MWVEVDATDAGQLPVSDARLLPDGRLVVAVDGAGIRVVRPSGRVQAEFDVAADFLIPSDNGLRLLALRAVEDDVVAVTVIAIPDRKVRRIGEVPATSWAHTFDGANWFLGNRGQLWMLDMLADGPVALWRETQHQEPIVAISRTPGTLAVASALEHFDELEGRMAVVRPIWPPRLGRTLHASGCSRRAPRCCRTGRSFPGTRPTRRMEPESSPARATTSPWSRTSTTWKRRSQSCAWAA